MKNHLLFSVLIILLFQTAKLIEPHSVPENLASYESKSSDSRLLTESTVHYSPGSKCEIGSDGQDPCSAPYYCTDGVCKHKNIFPDIWGREIGGSILILIIIGFSSAAGSGGSTFVNPIFVLLFGYTVNEAVRLVYEVVFGGLVSGLAFKTFLREPKYNRPVIVYDIALICAPLLGLGAKLGTLANTVLPEIVIVIFLWSTDALVFRKMWKNIQETRRRERESQVKPEVKEIEAQTAHDHSPDAVIDTSPGALKRSDDNAQMRIVEVRPFQDSAASVKTAEPLGDSNLPIVVNNPLLKNLLKKETRLFPWEYYLQFIVYLALSFLLQTINGSKGAPSIAGIEYCDSSYWVAYVLGNILLGLVFWIIGVLTVKSKIRAREEADMDLSGEYKLTRSNVWKLSLIALVVGFLGGAIGMGGSTLFVPLLLSFGMPPLRATSTATFLAIFTSTTSVFVSLISKKVTVVDAVYLFGIAFLGATVIANPIVYYTQKYKRTSLLSLILFYLLLITLTYYPGYQIWRLVVASSETVSSSSLC